MPREIKMPKLSDTMEEGTINAWRKREGDEVKRGEPLLEVETDKADMEYEAYVAGTLVKILVREGETVSVGTPIGIVRLESDSDEDLEEVLAKHGEGAGGGDQDEDEDEEETAEAPDEDAEDDEEAEQEDEKKSEKEKKEKKDKKGKKGKKRKPAEEREPAEEEGEERPAAAGRRPLPTDAIASLPPRESRLAFFSPDPSRVRATPRARSLAEERSLDLSEIAGTGPDGAVLAADVEAYAKALEEAAPPAEGDVPVTPVAARIAEEMGIDVSRVKGTGPGGRVTKRDLRAFVDGEERRVTRREEDLYGDEIKLSQKRKFLTRQMVESKQNTPHFYISMDVDAGPLRALRERLKEEGRSITYTHLIVKAAALALEDNPDVNATWREDRIVRFKPINVAVAVAVGDELVAPVVKDCQGRPLDDLAAATDVLIEKARERKLAPDDYANGTFTISNLGMFGVDHFYAIITPPQATVLSVGRMRETPVVAEGELATGRRMTFGLGVDHRVLDGAKAAQFLADLRTILEAPERLVDDGDGA